MNKKEAVAILENQIKVLTETGYEANKVLIEALTIAVIELNNDLSGGEENSWPECGECNGMDMGCCDTCDIMKNRSENKHFGLDSVD